jgi:phosphopantothenoylcysteine decarboxylase/phosphopantothenate--cysteine ligase
MLKDKNILIGISGSIAAYKIPLLVRLLKKAEANVKVVMSPASTDFVTPLTLSVLSQEPVSIESFDEVDGSWNSHVDLGAWADLFIIAPLSANSMSGMVSGKADNLLLTTYLSAKCPVYFAPAMDLDMYKHPSTQFNIKKLQEYGNILIEPGSGELASGLCGEGRMEEPEKIFGIISDHFKKKSDFTGKKVLLTAGPTIEKIDPVRFISNFSTGKMGYAIANAFAQRGAEVTIVSGPVNIAVNHPGIAVIPVQSADEMYSACMNLADEADILIFTAAVADYKSKTEAKQKLKKQDNTDELNLELIKNPDILASVAANKKKHQLIVGFALETNNEKENAFEKLRNKNADLIVLNSLSDEGSGFATDTNKISIIEKDSFIEFELMSKKEVAEKLADHIAQYKSYKR